MNKLHVYPNNNLSNKFKITADNGYTQLSQLMDVGAWSDPFVFDIQYTSSLAPASNNAVGIAERGMLHAFDYTGKHFYCIDASKGWQESPYALKSDLQSFLMYKEFTTETREWTPLTSYRISHTTPTGYSFLAYCHTRTNGWVGSVHPTPININEMSDLWTSVGSGTGTVTLGILFVKAA